MSYQCKNCEREKDQNNNYVNATYAANAHGTRGSRSSSTRAGSARNATGTGGSNNENANGSTAIGGTAAQVTGATQVTAKVMWGSVGAIKELREKEQAERNQVTRAGRRQ